MSTFAAVLTLYMAIAAHPGQALHIGDQGAAVKTLQTALEGGGTRPVADGVFGPATRAAVMAFEKAHGLAADGVAGPKTLAALDRAVRPTAVIKAGDRGAAVETAQNILDHDGAGLKTDGVFGPNTEAAVKAFQRRRHLAVDGIVGTHTWDALADPVATVRSGDTLARIAADWGVGVLAIARANGIAPNRITPGERLVIPVVSGSAHPPSKPTAKPTAKTPVKTPEPSTSTGQTPTTPPTAPAKWGGAKTPFVALTFYGSPDPTLLAAAAKIGVPVTVFFTEPPAAALPTGVTFGVDAMGGTDWQAVVGAPSYPGGKVPALATPSGALDQQLVTAGLVPIIPGVLVPADTEALMTEAVNASLTGGRSIALPLSGTGIRAGTSLVQSLEKAGYRFESLKLLDGF